MNKEIAKQRAEQMVADLAHDKEGLHGQLDELLIEVLRSEGYDSLCDIFEKADKWYA